MKKTLFDDKWKLIRGQVNTRWNLIAEYDLKKVDKSEAKLSKFATLLQVKYGYTRPVAKVHINRLLAEYEARTHSLPETEIKKIRTRAA
jgi:hypothetical protein